jgi:hypothetical protein
MAERIKIQGGPGNKPDNAWIVEGITGGPDFEPIKRDIISKSLGPMVKNWIPVTRNRFRNRGRTYEELIVETPDGKRSSIYLDVTNYKGLRAENAA